MGCFMVHALNHVCHQHSMEVFSKAKLIVHDMDRFTLAKSSLEFRRLEPSARQYTGSPHTNQYLSFASHHPTAHKVAVVRILMSRASAPSSSGVEQVEEEVKIVEALKENGYPSSFIHRLSGPSGTRQKTSIQRPPRSIVTLPYIKGLSETVRRNLAPLDIKVVFRPLNTLRSLLVHQKLK